MNLEPVSVALKLGFLVVLYLFLLWVVRSALKDLRRAQPSADAAYVEEAPPADATAMHSAADDMLGDHVGGGEPRLVVEHAAGHPDGIAYDLSSGATLGRGNVEIRLEDPFASSQHARIERQGGVLVLEDLGSTNGTFLNEEQLRGIQPLHHGDRIRIGDSEFSYLQD
ncbi:FHA domain-containing protein [Conexibacter sp. JD483]|uniref:FHA domain-containing protein n=1 Tax=unclassified Conexibacter TaxID=2627773 RepID=UPI00271F2531|nr:MULTISPECIES: FHA domain-containing protein [unclassified Conexibacter]MDO8184459.1 FHA domain-containing protein [Conexibacter sp. CPCC 205706]MDO8197765.1 FHA domain-containing protein [Conexibacter sp. CPCC 205762]MDR9368099.1 FHA domain-containing protein [Conexibacter sp. JD483]